MHTPNQNKSLYTIVYSLAVLPNGDIASGCYGLHGLTSFCIKICDSNNGTLKQTFYYKDDKDHIPHRSDVVIFKMFCLITVRAYDEALHLKPEYRFSAYVI